MLIQHLRKTDLCLKHQPGSARVKCFDQHALCAVRLTYVRVNRGFLRVNAAQHGDSAVVQTELCSALGCGLSVCALGASS